MRSRRRVKWDAGGVRALRYHLGMTQQEMAGELGVRQQTVSEWETGSYRPRGPSATLLSLVAEGAGFQYEGGRPEEKGKARVISHTPLERGSPKHENVIPAPEPESRVKKSGVRLRQPGFPLPYQVRDKFRGNDKSDTLVRTKKPWRGKGGQE